MYDDKTEKLKLPLPHVKNELIDDCPRIRDALGILDKAVGEAFEDLAAVKTDTAIAVKTAGEAKAAASEASGAAKTAISSAQEASVTAAAAQIDAEAAADLASSAKTVADRAASVADEAKADAAGAKATASAAVPKTGARGSLAGYEAIGDAESLGEPPTVTIESPDCLNLETAGTLTIAFTAADPSMRAVKALSLTATDTTSLTIEGAVWQNNGEAPEWGTAGKILVILAHFVGGRVVLSVADNTEA